MNFHRLFDIFPYQQARFPHKVALAKRADGDWTRFSPEQCLQEINRVSAGLLQLGIKRGDKVAIIASVGSPRWIFFDLGAQQIGAIVVPLHASLSVRELEYIFKETTAKVAVAATPELYEKIAAMQSDLPTLISLEDKVGNSGRHTFLQEPDEALLIQIEAAKNTIQEDDTATIIYTSGTTGEPKGVLLSHKNIVSNIKSILPLIPINYYHNAFSFLPPSHIFERMVVYSYLAVGATVYYPENRETALRDLQQAKPQNRTLVYSSGRAVSRD